jgi:DNA ligase (NAD+)
LQLPELLTITVRGEVMMSKENFDRLNQAQVKAGGKLYANPRNAAAGSLRTHDIEATRSRELSFHAYAMMLNDAASLGISCQIDALSKLASLGFAVNQLVGRAYGLQQVLDNFNYIESIRKDLPIEIDGVVFKVNNFEHQRQLGWTSRTPKWAIACKFKPEEQETEIVEIVAQVGRTGVLTPVAYLTPVTVGGVVVSKATLHNQDQVNLKGIGAGDVVMVRRAGDVIPEIVRVTRKRYNGTVWQMPLSCPSCNSKVIQKPGGHFCSGVQHCPAQLLGKLSHYVGRAGMDIKGLGEHILDELVETKLVEKVSELYELIPEYQGLTIRSYSEKTWQGLLDSIEINGRRKPLRKFIYALGIPNVGEGTAKRLAQAFGTWSLFRAATFELLCAITDIGETTATSIMEAFESEEISKEMDITASFVQPLPDKQPDVGVLTGKTVVVTGAFETGTREDIHEMVERAGGTADGTVTSKTSYLVAGKNAGSKLAKAKELNVPILDEQAFIKLFN